MADEPELLDGLPPVNPKLPPSDDLGSQTAPDEVDADAREADQAAGLGLTLEAYRALDPEHDEPELTGLANQSATTTRRPPPLDITEDRSNVQKALDGDLLPPRMQANRRYESRISIVEAYQYNGIVVQAPDWVDRNWIGYADHDPLRGIEPGPCLRVPNANGQLLVARPGDYVCKQEVILVPGLPGEEKIEVWEREQFERLFVPSSTR